MTTRPCHRDRARCGRRGTARLGVLGAVLAAVLTPGAAVRAEDNAGAAALFAEAGRLINANQPSSACPRYEESLRLLDSINTRYFLADCYERIGRMASAWALFLEVAARGHASRDAAKEAKARERAAAVQPKLSHLTVVVADPPTPAIEVKRDGTPVGPGQWGVPMPVDPGVHLIQASAPGKRPWTARIEVAPKGPTATITVPALEDGGGTSDEDEIDAGRPRRTLALVVGGAGLVTAGVATALAIAARSKFDESSELCNGDRCTQRGVDIRESAVARADVATVVFGVGLAAIAGGGALWLTAPSSTKRASLRLTPTLGGALVQGRF